MLVQIKSWCVCSSVLLHSVYYALMGQAYSKLYHIYILLEY